MIDLALILFLGIVLTYILNYVLNQTEMDEI